MRDLYWKETVRQELGLNGIYVYVIRKQPKRKGRFHGYVKSYVYIPR